MTPLTGQDFLAYPGKHLHVEHISDDAFHGPELRAEAQREKHHEEAHRPEVTARELHDGLREHDEGQPSALCSLGRGIREVDLVLI